MEYLLWTLLLCSSLVIVSGERYTLGHNFLLGNSYDILFKELARCPEEGKRLMYYNLDKIRRINRQKHVVSGKIILKEGLHDGLWGRLNIAAKSGGTWVENYFITKGGPFCTAANNILPHLFKRILNALGHSECPVPPGNYTVRDLDLSPDFQLPMIPLNKYRVRVLIDKNNTRIGCAQLVVDVVKKQ